MQEEKKPIIISVGGSLIIQDSINIEFLSKLKLILEEKIKEGERFILVTGGGKVCRTYQSAIQHFFPESPIDSDWIGIHVTNLNAHLLKLIFQGNSHHTLFGNPKIKHDWISPILLGGGYEPGHSSDYDAVCLASTYNVKKVINLSNIDYVYTADPKTSPDAEKIEKTTWDAFFKIIPKEWSPGLNSPFDPMAARMAKNIGIEVVIINGAHLDRMEDYLSGKEFVGTTISD
jgi:uridylate kinase